ncbi:acetaldehyde dehydrogenase (acetylating) [Agromyces archimandritae]|uniref:Acetaldehyde dehydrogenase n=1 Tax=Agromyces archimandritae TaxID=2781962 RepID=A0A975FPD8_9MICO|nr:acetaldehyde dehydrogenase (acetylating) [Agromyces archimandritae]QTX05666.1 acetaldehyde dehydrogenase (acetylating) [Agromyces archimandritae]
MAAMAAIVGSGNIGTDLMMKLLRDDALELRHLIGIDPESEGLARARALGVETSHEGVDWLLAQDELPDIVFDATSAATHEVHAPRLAEAGVRTIDLTPAAVGPFLCPAVNAGEYLDAPNVNMITCGGQATIPIVHAVSSVTPVAYAEIVASISSRSAGPGTRANIDEFTHTTSRAIAEVGGAAKGKAIVVLNPVRPEMLMRDTVFCALDADADTAAITASVERAVARVAHYVPGYRLVSAPRFDAPREEWNGAARVTVMLEVEGNGDFLPPWAGNLDIMTAAAARVGHLFAERLEGALR